MKHVGILLDASGSMFGEHSRVVTGVNEYIQELRQTLKGKKCKVNIDAFNSVRTVPLYRGTLKKLKEFTGENYKPGAMTPLYDAIGNMIKEFEEKTIKGDKVAIIIDTDGYENTSHEFEAEDIKALVKAKEKEGWKFTFLATGIDEATATGVSGAALHMGFATCDTQISTHADRSATYAVNAGQTADYFAEDTDK